MPRGRYRLGIDIGGTFTDLALLDERSGGLLVGKTLTTPDDPAEGAIAGLQRLLAEHGVDAAEVDWTVHATTLMTNALIERKGARTGLLTTKGFRDVLAIGRELRYDLYDLFQERPAPLVERRDRQEVGERIGADGTVRRPLDTADVRRALDELVAAGVESVAIVFLHAYGNDAHERQAESIAAVEFPRLFVSPSYRVAPEIREYERTSTTVANAYVQPLAARYLAHLGERLHELGLTGTLYLMVSAGGIASATAARERPIALTESGPAAGALVGGYYGTLAGERNVLAFDMGGTTAKVCLVDDGRPLVSYGFEAGRVQRFKKGSGLPLRVPAIELIEIGAGGGSIARLDRLGLLKVGPDSAGASPGPAAYGRGGREPTVTDADLLLGYLDPDYFLGGEMRLDVEAARAAVAERLAAPLGRDVAAVAWGVHDIVNENMASAARIHVAERGRDPRRYALVATGGAAPVHACRVARKLRLSRVLCPLGSGVASTVGLLVAPPQVDLVHAYIARLDELDWERLEALYDAMRGEAAGLLGRLGVAPEAITFEPLADLRYVGQGFEVLTPLPAGPYGPATRSAFTAAFETAYRALYQRLVPGAEIEGLHWRLRASGPSSGARQVSAALRARGEAGGAAGDGARRGERPVYFPETDGFAATPIYDRYRLRPGDRLRGPAIVEERESTVVVVPGAAAHVDPHLTLVIDLEES
ncbi:MAG TPA: hydantoinase/oxoprolinase family protein [Thermomicrobiaceae bacterium]|nr:hydantoinase/oxoprolinase family protein [Thermomicrobiaceae bacterium]